MVGSRVRDRAVLPPRGGARPSGDVELGPFRLECDAAIARLRRSLLELAEAADCDPLRPQEVARRFDLNKNLTWKIARLLGARDYFEAISMLPGREGIEIYLRAFDSVASAEPPLRGAREAFRAIEEVIERHFGDRGQLDLVLDAVRSDGNLENSRRIAFRGMSGVFGVQAKVRLTSQIIAPSREGAMADIALVAGLVGLQRLRPRGRLPVFRWNTGGAGDRPGPTALFPGEHEHDFLMREHSSFPKATIHVSTEDGRHIMELSEGPLGLLGASDLFFGSVARSIMRTTRAPDDTHTEFVTAISIPAEGLVSDLFIHKSIGGLDTLATSLHSTLAQPLSLDAAARESARLPIEAGAVLVEDLATGFGIPEVPRYEAMLGRAFEVLGQDPGAYRLVRVALPYPPAPSALLVRWELPE